MEVERCRPHVCRRPVVLVPPLVRSHHKPADQLVSVGTVVNAFEPPIKKAKVDALQRRDGVGPEIPFADPVDRQDSADMVPWSDQEPLLVGCRRFVHHAAVVEERSPLIAVEPAGDVQNGEVYVLEVPHQRQVPPVVVEGSCSRPGAPHGIGAPQTRSRSLRGRCVMIRGQSGMGMVWRVRPPRRLSKGIA